MTPDLSRRAAKALATLHRAGRIKSPWLPGMLAQRDQPSPSETWRVIVVDDHDTWVCTDDDEVLPNSHPNVVVGWMDAVPDLTDPLTVQGLVLLAGEAWGQPEARTCDLEGYDGYRWILIIVSDLDLPHRRSGVVWFCDPDGTEAGAAVAALEAAAAEVSR